MARVTVKNLTKRFGRITAVNRLNLDVEDKKFVCLLGPSGCGKTTTLRMIAGLEVPDEGEIYIGDELVNDLTPAERDIAMVFQFYALYPTLNVYENLAFPLKAQKTPRDEIDKRVKEVAEILGVSNILHLKPDQLTPGESQRVAIGRAIIRRPRVYLLDEPLTNLDAKLRARMRAELKRLQKELGQTAIYVTHDQLEAMTMADKIAVMNLGVLQQYDTPDNVYNHPENLFVAGFIGSPSMNFIECTLTEKDNHLYLDSGEFQLDVSDLKDLILEGAKGKEVVLGVRPEHIAVEAKPTGRYSFQGEVYVVEPLGDQTILDFQVGKNIVKAIVSPDFKADIGDKLWLVLSKDRFHIIDKKTEKVII
ncbi:MAG: ABC transporter ATP-binding protein [Candidatus Bathyarchaeia archaeon]